MRGDQIKRGDIIADSGQTGSVSTPQFYFEVRNTRSRLIRYAFSKGGLDADPPVRGNAARCLQLREKRTVGGRPQIPQCSPVKGAQNVSSSPPLSTFHDPILAAPRLAIFCAAWRGLKALAEDCMRRRTFIGIFSAAA